MSDFALVVLVTLRGGERRKKPSIPSFHPLLLCLPLLIRPLWISHVRRYLPPFLVGIMTNSGKKVVSRDEVVDEDEKVRCTLLIYSERCL